MLHGCKLASRPRQAAAVEGVEAGLAKECQLASRPRQAAAVEAVEAGLEGCGGWPGGGGVRRLTWPGGCGGWPGLWRLAWRLTALGEQ